MDHQKVPVSICIIAHNEEHNIADCLDSVVDQAGQVIVLDAGSTDRTSEIVERYPKVKLLHFPNERNLNVNKMRTIAEATEPWIFYFDADERFTPELWEEIARVTDPQTGLREYAGYRVGRKNFYFGRWLRYGGQYPDLQPRLLRRGKGGFAMKHIHEFLQIDGPVGDLREPFLHYTYLTVAQYFKKFDFYADFQAEKWAEAGVRWSALNNWKYGIVRPIGRFIQKYIVMAGFRDGFLGLAIAALQGTNELAAYLRIHDHVPRQKK